MTQTLNKVKGMTIVKELINKMLASTDTQLKDGDLPNEIDIKDSYEFDLVTQLKKNKYQECNYLQRAVE